VSIWGWLKLTIAVWLFRQALQLTGWLIVAAVAVAAWPVTVVAAVGYLAGVAAGLAPGPAVASRLLVTADDRRLFRWASAAVAVLDRGRAGPGERLG
jgi:hypothetical protein